MGVAFSDVVTSAPSAWGASNATAAAWVFPLGWPVAVALMALVSDPAQIWHAADRYGTVARLVRQANDQMTEAVTRRSRADDWTERGRDAFMANRLQPYQAALDEAAGMYDDMDHALKASSVSYTALGLSSATVGAALLSFVAPFLAAAVVPGLNASATYVANTAMVEAGTVVRSMVAGLAKVNGALASVLSGLAVRLGVSESVILGLGAGTLGAAGGYQTFGRAAPTMRDSVRSVPWPKDLGGESSLPSGYRRATAADLDALKSIRPPSIEALGRDLDLSASESLDEACALAGGNDVGLPGFGGAGVHLAGVCLAMRDSALRHLTAGRDQPGTWLPALRTVAGNWANAEQATVGATGHGR
ncbi:hypothetical protein [Sphaerisporangium perillae]|uniref:hypothetical protein n=1 Tax=Sphaerisporangium perillae TaxID=2935860 RepID=UPI002010C2BE|nr:hypothetical protein [Sphaerisporangium perillae]